MATTKNVDALGKSLKQKQAAIMCTDKLEKALKALGLSSDQRNTLLYPVLEGIAAAS